MEVTKQVADDPSHIPCLGCLDRDRICLNRRASCELVGQFRVLDPEVLLDMRVLSWCYTMDLSHGGMLKSGGS